MSISYLSLTVDNEDMRHALQAHGAEKITVCVKKHLVVPALGIDKRFHFRSVLCVVY